MKHEVQHKITLTAPQLEAIVKAYLQLPDHAKMHANLTEEGDERYRGSYKVFSSMEFTYTDKI